MVIYTTVRNPLFKIQINSCTDLGKSEVFMIYIHNYSCKNLVKERSKVWYAHSSKSHKNIIIINVYLTIGSL